VFPQAPPCPGLEPSCGFVASRFALLGLAEELLAGFDQQLGDGLVSRPDRRPFDGDLVSVPQVDDAASRFLGRGASRPSSP
jgi:hypothetical protein